MTRKKIIASEIDVLEEKIAQVQTEVWSLTANALSELNEIVNEATQNINQELTSICETIYKDKQQPNGWDDDLWKDYKPIVSLNEETLPDSLHVGEWLGHNDVDIDLNDTTDIDNDLPFRHPAYIPFLGNQRSLIIIVNNEFKIEGVSLMRAIIQRIHTLIPHYSQFTLLDTETNGVAFPMQRDVFTRKSDADMYHVLEDVINDMKRITSMSALTKDEYFSTKVESITEDEKYEFICVTNFPKEYEPRSIERLANIGNNGYVSGKYLIMVYNEDEPMPRDMFIDMFKNAQILNMVTYDTCRIEEKGRVVEYVAANEATSEEWRFICNRLCEFKAEDCNIT